MQGGIKFYLNMNKLNRQEYSKKEFFELFPNSVFKKDINGYFIYVKSKTRIIQNFIIDRNGIITKCPNGLNDLYRGCKINDLP
jgi:hypothetical protein